MKLNQNDIGGEIISILTKGMYVDPKDALREYVQNGVDADADRISIKIRLNNIVIEDNGFGMDSKIMRNAIRVGISEKNPKKSVGFMGIGIYSAFHLCNKLAITSKIENTLPNRLIFDFRQMREILEFQKEIRFENSIEKQQIDLLTLLEKHITFETLKEEDYNVTSGTRVEIEGLEPSFFMSLAKFEEVSEYLERVVPLPFDPDFKYGNKIQAHIEKVCKKHRASFRIINLTLQINSDERVLYRPYKNDDFSPSPLPPKFYNLESSDGYLGIMWTCLNKGKQIINDKVRGFILKKHGFTLGTRKDLLHRFGQKFFSRAIGEVIVISPKLLPNAARTDFEYSNLRVTFYNELDRVIREFNNYANRHQEIQKAEQELDKTIEEYKEIRAQLKFFENNADKLLEFNRVLYDLKSKLEKRDKTGWKIPTKRAKDAKEILKLLTSILKEINELIDIKSKKKQKYKRKKDTTVEDLEKAPKTKKKNYDEPEPENLLQVIKATGLEFDSEIGVLIELIDEFFVRGGSTNLSDYKQRLVKFRSEIEDIYSIE